MNLFPLLPTALSALALFACATASTAQSSLPSETEVVTYVTTKWSYYEARFAFLSERRGQSSTVISVTDVECGDEDGHAKCTFVVQGRFEDGVVLSRPMESRFGRDDDGSIGMLIQVTG